MESAGAYFFRAKLGRFSRHVAQFRRSWSSGKMLAFQPRGCVCANFFTSTAKQKGPLSTFFGTMRLPPFSASNLIFCNRIDVKNFQEVHLSTVLGIVRFFKYNIFRLKIKFFSGSARYILVLFFFEERSFFYAIFQIEILETERSVRP